MHGKHRRLSSQVHHIEDVVSRLTETVERGAFSVTIRHQLNAKAQGFTNSSRALVPQTRIAVRLQLIYDTGGIGWDFGKLAGVVDAIIMVALNPG